MSESPKYLIGDKPVWKSATMLGSAVVALGPVAESFGYLPPGGTAAIVQGAGIILAAFGLRRKVGGGS